MDELVLPKNISVGIYDSRISVKDKSITDNRITSSFEIELPTEHGGISFIDEDKFRITPETVICVKPGQQRHTKLPFKCYFLHMEIENGILYELLTDTPNYFIAKDRNMYKKIFDDMFDYYDSSKLPDDIILYSRILELIYNIHSDCRHIQAKKKKTNANTKLIDEAIKFIETNFNSELTLDTIAQHISLSPIHFHNKFKAVTGKTPHQFLNEIRLNRAKKLLVSTNMKLSQIAYECGFSSQAYFNYVFKKHMNMTPREYMKKIFDSYQ
ncbi:MAG: helix-turn-helix transcriptional regulator [Clostridia bacterium]|nr:helix-turn-helix transcriptional regulator [Clostridia bacterium]